ncbi:hypothetical protein [Candidatus Nitrospira salsa]
MPGSMNNDSSSSKPNIHIYPGHKELKGDEREVTAKLRSSRVLSDVKLMPLNWIGKRWIERSSKPTAGAESTSIFPLQKGPILIFFLMPGSEYEGEVLICARRGGIPLRRWEKWIIQSSFSFSKPVHEPFPLTIEDAIQDFLSETLSAIDIRQKHNYVEALKSLNHFFSVLLECSLSSFQENNIKNYVELGDPFRFGSLFQGWLKNYRDLFARTASILHEDPEYFEYAAHIPKNLLIESLALKSPTVANDIVRLGRSAFLHLQVWWVRRAEEQGATSHNCSSGVDLNPPYAGIYKTTLMSFVGSWERLGQAFYQGSPQEEGNWENLSMLSMVFQSHIANTLFMLMAAIEKGDSAGAYWMCDVLQKWWVQKHYEKGYTVKKDYFLTLNCFNKGRSIVEEQVQLRDITNQPADLPFKIFASALYNYWIDILTLSILLLVDRGEMQENSDPIALKVAKNLIHGSLAHHEGTFSSGEIKPIKLFKDLLQTFLRQRFQETCKGEETYHSILDSLLQAATDDSSHEMVSGRIYSMFGGASLYSLISIQAFLLCIFAPSQDDWEPDQELKDDITSLGLRNDEITWGIIDFFYSLSKELTELEDSRWEIVFKFLKDGQTSDVDFGQARGKTKRAIDLLKSFTKNLRETRIKTAEIDLDRISSLEKAFSKTVFKKEEAP